MRQQGVDQGAAGVAGSGCTTIPAALLITIRSLSSYSTSSGIASPVARRQWRRDVDRSAPPQLQRSAHLFAINQYVAGFDESLDGSPGFALHFRLRKRSILVGSFSGE
jgi:hypothetical protein